MTTYAAPMSGAYAADQIHSSVGFAVKYMGISTFRGTLGTVAAELTAGSDRLALTGSAEVDSISIRTPEQFRAHILGEQFFDADRHPQLTFTSNDVVLDQDGTALVRGQLTIRGIAQAVTARGSWSPPTPDPMGRTRSHLALEAIINRRDYGITWEAPLPSGGSALADEVTLTAELALVAKE
jgi:polyisoprenoid-binding protein YceI